LKENCEYRATNSGKCYFGPKKKNNSDEIHIGTENKIQFIESYVEGWINKLLNGPYPYESLVFVDAMSSCGEYINKNKEKIEGTSLRVLKLFNKYANSEKYKGKKYYLIVNDLEEREIECQKCRINSIGKNKNVFTIETVSDVKDFLINPGNFLPKAENFHLLLLYDPYKVNILWKELKHFLTVPISKNGSKLKFDLIITHFGQHDTLRLDLDNIKDEVKNRLENSYKMSLDKLSELLGNDSEFEKKRKLRERFREVIADELQVDERDISYAPVFNKLNKDVYDIVFYSTDSKARQLFKKTIYLATKDRLKSSESYGQLDLNLSVSDDEKYHASIEELREIQYYYSAKSYASIVAHYFAGKEITNDQLKDFLINHEFIPSESVKTDLDKFLKDLHGVKICSKPSKTYVFQTINGDRTKI
jgi:three-Cys-motif partner protein